MPVRGIYLLGRCFLQVVVEVYPISGHCQNANGQTPFGKPCMSSQFPNDPSDSFLARELQRHQIQMLAMEAFILRKINEQRISIDEADQVGAAFLNVIQGQAGIDTVQATPLGIAILKQASHIRRELFKQLLPEQAAEIDLLGLPKSGPSL